MTFSAISGANANTYTIPTALSQTTYFRRAFRSYCDTIYSNTVTVTVYNGAQGTPNTFGNGLWNAYVYNAADYTTSYSGYYTTASALLYNSTTDFGVTAAPSTAPNYQGCQVNQNGFSIRYQRTNFTPGTYQIDIPMNDDGMNIILDGTTIYTSAGYNPSPRTNVWTGTLTATSQLEIRFNNNGGGNGQIESVDPSSVINTPPTAGTIAGNQVACNTVVPSFQLTSSVGSSNGRNLFTFVESLPVGIIHRVRELCDNCRCQFRYLHDSNCSFSDYLFQKRTAHGVKLFTPIQLQ